eukprot:20064-Heterococcus_DN1.PRE.1
MARDSSAHPDVTVDSAVARKSQFEFGFERGARLQIMRLAHLLRCCYSFTHPYLPILSILACSNDGQPAATAEQAQPASTQRSVRNQEWRSLTSDPGQARFSLNSFATSHSC